MLGEESEPDRDDGDEAADVRRPPVPPLQRLARALEDDDDDVELVATPRLPSKPGKRARSAVQGRLDLGPTGAYETPALTLLHLPKDAGRNRSDEHTYELPSLTRITYAVLCLKTKQP